VTGSRIPHANLAAPTAVTTISSEVLQMSGTVNVSEMLRSVPSFGVSGISSTNSNFATAGAGINTLELRNLGEKRTLVLVNGRRYVAGVAGSSSVDFNTVPTDMIDRVEVITGGASAVYGSDALAGVVNVILKNDYEGLAADVQTGRSEYDDDVSYKAHVMFGDNFANNKGNIVLSATYSKNEGVMAKDRGDLRSDLTVSGAKSSYSAYGRIAVQADFKTSSLTKLKPSDPNSISAIAGAVDVVGSGAGPTGTVSAYGGTYGFDRQPYRAVETPVERLLFAANGHYNVTNNTQFYVETTFANTRSEANIEPYPLDSSSLNNIPGSAGGGGGISIYNPYVPAAIRTAALAAQSNLYVARDAALAQAAAAATPTLQAGWADAAAGFDQLGQADNYLTFRRRLVEFGPRHYSANRDMWRIVTGAKGTILNNYNWDVYFDWGHTLDTQNGTGQINIPNLREAVQAHAATAADVAANATVGGAPAAVGTIICDNTYAQAEGCVPVNIFGLGAVTPAALKYVTAPQSRIDNIDEQVLGGSIAGPVYTLPAGDISLVTGFEYRREYATDVPDALSQSGQNAGNKEPETRGGYHVLEFFGETEIPILKDAFLAKELLVSGAWRWSQYGASGATTVTNAYTGRVSWSPVEDLRFRGQYAKAVRAPSINELFAPGGEDFAPVSDPCDSANTPTGSVLANCKADPTVAARMAATGSFTLSLAEQQGTGGTSNKGSTALTPEKSDTWTLGAVLNHDFGSYGALMLSVDYFSIDIKNVITTVGRQQALDLCYGGSSYPNAFCNMIVRKSSGGAFQQGAITQVNSGYTNQGYVKENGIDISLSHNFDLNELDWMKSGLGANDVGQLATRLNWTYTNGFSDESFGTVTNDNGTVGIPKHKAQLAVVYQNGPLNIQWETDFQSRIVISRTPTSSFYNQSVRPYYLNNLSASYQITDQFQLFGGVNNLLNIRAPQIGSGVPGNTTGTNTAADVYDPIGRRFFIGGRVKL
jgi:outer membrane receptor protein involved in Fe transport